jgi:hypothetical protein
MKEKLKLNFTDMWGYDNYQFNPHDNYFTDMFSLKYDVVITANKPDLLIYSVFGQEFKKYDCKKIFFTGENFSKERIPDHYNLADLVLSHYDDSEKEVLFPLWVIFINWFNKKQPRPLPSNPTYLVNLDDIQNNRERFLKNRKFCAFINNNPIDDRMELFNRLNNYRRVDSWGNLFNNVGKPLRGSEQDKINLLSDYKFTVAFENSYHSGYNTEKIIQPLEAGCIPLYSGGERVSRYFNTGSFLYRQAYDTPEHYIQQIKSINENQDIYENMVMTNPLLMDNIMNDFDPHKILNKLTTIL